MHGHSESRHIYRYEPRFRFSPVGGLKKRREKGLVSSRRVLLIVEHPLAEACGGLLVQLGKGRQLERIGIERKGSELLPPPLIRLRQKPSVRPGEPVIAYSQHPVGASLRRLHDPVRPCRGQGFHFLLSGRSLGYDGHWSRFQEPLRQWGAECQEEQERSEQ